MLGNDLIEGKDKTQGIVSMEDNRDGTMQLFIQNADGEVSEKLITNNYWILTDSPADSQSKKLAGSGHYLYKNEFTLRDDFEYAKRHFKKFGDKAWWVNNIKEQAMLQRGMTYYKGLKHKDVSVLSFDIESLSLEHTSDARVIIISNTFRDAKGNIERKLFCYDEFNSDKEMLEGWCAWVRNKNPSIVLGHNIYGFDLPYMSFCSDRTGTELTLGRKRQPITFNSYSSKFRKDGSQFIEYNKCFIYGREIVDTFQLAIRYDVVNKKYESYALKAIIKAEGLEKPGRQHYDASLIRKNYLIPEEWKKIKTYAGDDADDALVLWDLMGPSSFYWCQSVPKPFGEVTSGATGSQINSMLVRAYFQQDHSLPKATEITRFAGGVSIGIPGIYSNTFKVDILSAYPSTILVYKIYDSMKDPKAYFLEIVRYFFESRKEYKKKAKETGEQYYKDMDATSKIAINSMYGTLGTNGLLFNSEKCASLITDKCRGYIDIAVIWATGKNLEHWKNLNVNA